LELKQYVKPLLKWWWLIVASTLVATLSSFLATRQQPSIYSAEATLMVGRSLESPNPVQYDLYLSERLGKTYADLADRKPIKDAVQAALGLKWSPAYSVRMLPDTQLLEIRSIDTDPLRAQAIANEVANQLILQTPAEERDMLQRREFLSKELQQTEAVMEETKAQIQRLRDQMAGMFSARQIVDTRAEIAALEQKLSTYKADYVTTFNLLKGGTNTLHVVETAERPEAPIGPNNGLTILLAAAIGFILAAGAAYLLEYLDDTLKNPEDVKSALKLSTLGSLTRIEGDQSSAKLVAAFQPDSPSAEACRVLRTNLQFSSLDTPLRTLVVTSAHPREGKSTTVANLAVVMAQQGKRVIVVDTDLRRPSQHQIFGLPNNTGVTSALLQDPPACEGLLKATLQENLWALTAGPLPPYPSEMLSSRRFAALLDDLKQRADVVLFDCPPVLAVADAAILASQVDGVLFVVDAGITRRQQAIRACEALQNVGARVLGVVINRIKSEHSDYYSYSRYYASRSNSGTGGRQGRAARRLAAHPPAAEPDTGATAN